MRSLLLHCKELEMTITGLATRPADIAPEKILHQKSSSRDCILAFVTVEQNDTIEKAEGLVQEIKKFCVDTHHNILYLCPFAHLSHNLASSKEALSLFNVIEKNLQIQNIPFTRGHFGSDKELFLYIFGHPGNVRYREF